MYFPGDSSLQLHTSYVLFNLILINTEDEHGFVFQKLNSLCHQKPDGFCTYTVVLYGWKTRNTPTRELHILQSSINTCLRIILSVFRFLIPNTISNKSLWKSTNQDTIINEIRWRKRQWHTYIRGGERFTEI